ncbi:MAG TPA: hypothetical protein VMX33_02600 [bacterium]|nr:hypothetical protein [bacterium]
MRTMLAFILCFVCVITAVSQVAPPEFQPPGDEDLKLAIGQTVRIRTRGGGAFQGNLFGVGSDRLELVDGEGQIVQIARGEISMFEILDPSRDSAAYFQDAANNRLIVMPTGFGMEPRSLHVTSQEIIAVTTTYGLSEGFSLWGGISIPGAIASLRYAAPITPHVAFSIGSFAGATWVDPVGVILPYALVSMGHPNRDITLGAGLPFTLSPQKPISLAAAALAIGGKIIIARNASIVTETWLLAQNTGGVWDSLDMLILPAAVFRIAASRISWDIGAILPLRLTNAEGWYFGGIFDGSIFPLPVISITYRIM